MIVKHTTCAFGQAKVEILSFLLFILLMKRGNNSEQVRNWTPLLNFSTFIQYRKELKPKQNRGIWFFSLSFPNACIGNPFFSSCVSSFSAAVASRLFSTTTLRLHRRTRLRSTLLLRARSRPTSSGPKRKCCSSPRGSFRGRRRKVSA